MGVTSCWRHKSEFLVFPHPSMELPATADLPKFGLSSFMDVPFWASRSRIGISFVFQYAFDGCTGLFVLLLLPAQSLEDRVGYRSEINTSCYWKAHSASQIVEITQACPIHLICLLYPINKVCRHKPLFDCFYWSQHWYSQKHRAKDYKIYLYKTHKRAKTRRTGGKYREMFSRQNLTREQTQGTSAFKSDFQVLFAVRGTRICCFSLLLLEDWFYRPVFLKKYFYYWLFYS